MNRIYDTLKRLDERRAAALLDQEPDESPKVLVHDSPRASYSNGVTGSEQDRQDLPALWSPRYRSVSLRISKGPLCPFDGSDPRSAEQYRMIRTNLLLHPAHPKVIAVSSANAGDGKTVTTVNLAGTLSLRSDASVLIVDGDMRQCKIAACLGIPATPGLADVLRGACSLEDAIVRIEELPNLLVLPSGRAVSNPAELLDSADWKWVMSKLRAQFPFVVIDTTPVDAVADFQLVQQASDGVLLVLRPDHTRRAAFQRALSIVPKSKMLGTVLNAVPEWFLWNTKHDNYYYTDQDAFSPPS